MSANMCSNEVHDDYQTNVSGNQAASDASGNQSAPDSSDSESTPALPIAINTSGRDGIMDTRSMIHGTDIEHRYSHTGLRDHRDLLTGWRTIRMETNGNSNTDLAVYRHGIPRTMAWIIDYLMENQGTIFIVQCNSGCHRSHFTVNMVGVHPDNRLAHSPSTSTEADDIELF